MLITNGPFALKINKLCFKGIYFFRCFLRFWKDTVIRKIQIKVGGREIMPYYDRYIVQITVQTIRRRSKTLSENSNARENHTHDRGGLWVQSVVLFPDHVCVFVFENADDIIMIVVRRLQKCIFAFFFLESR